VIPLVELLANSALLVGREILKRFAVLEHALALLRRKITHLVHPGTRRAHPKLLARCGSIIGASAIPHTVAVVRSVIQIVVWPLIRVWRIVRSPIRVGRRAIRIRWLRVGWMRRSLMRGRLWCWRLMLRRPVGMRILRYAESGQGDTRSERENLHTDLEFPAPHFFSFLRLPCSCFLHLLRLLRIGSVFRLHRRRQILQRLKIL